MNLTFDVLVDIWACIPSRGLERELFLDTNCVSPHLLERWDYGVSAVDYYAPMFTDLFPKVLVDAVTGWNFGRWSECTLHVGQMWLFRG